MFLPTGSLTWTDLTVHPGLCNKMPEVSHGAEERDSVSVLRYVKSEGLPLLIDLQLEILLRRLQFRNIAQSHANVGTRSFFCHEPLTKRHIWRHFTNILQNIRTF